MDDNPTTAAPVDTAILRKAGLTESQAKGYLALIENGELSPVELAEKTGESRTNGYMICERLEKLGLATKKDGQKAGFYAQRVHEFTEALFIQNQITLNPAQQKVVDQMSDVIYNQEVNKPENQQLCKKMVQTISKVVDQTADRQGGR